MSQGVVQVHGASSGNHKHILNSRLQKLLGDIVGYLYPHDALLTLLPDSESGLFYFFICYSYVNKSLSF